MVCFDGEVCALLVGLMVSVCVRLLVLGWIPVCDYDCYCFGILGIRGLLVGFL